MAATILTRIRWTITRKATVALELLRSGDAIELASPPPQKSPEPFTFEWKKTQVSLSALPARTRNRR